ncbi:MAG: hypothetical protein AAF251_12155 [Pseudomonadota bacterium]
MSFLSPIRSRALPTCVPVIAISVAIAALASLTPVSAAAHSKAEKAVYVNTQFVESDAAQESGRLVIENTSVFPRKVYARFQMPNDPNNRNYGFFQTIPPLSKIAYDLPLGVRVFACDGKYWDDYRPDEAYAVTIMEEATYRFTHREFQPVALRRAKGE